MNSDSPSDARFSRRDALKLIGTGVAALGLGAIPAARAAEATDPAALPQPFSLPTLAYAYNALEPYIDAETMEIHHSKHHQAYITNANKALAGHPALAAMTAEEILMSLDKIPESERTVLRNNVGGHYNHSFFWRSIAPHAGGKPEGQLAGAIHRGFGSFEKFKAQFTDAGLKRFGSGWAWLVVTKDKALQIVSTPNQDNPITDGNVPVIGVDVWEHAYYLKYQNRRADYLGAYWSIIDWNQALLTYKKAIA